MAEEKKQSDSPEGGPEGVIRGQIPPPMGTLPPVIIPPTPPAVVAALVIVPSLKPPPITAIRPRGAAQTDELVAALAALAENVLQAAPEEKAVHLHKLVRRLRQT